MEGVAVLSSFLAINRTSLTRIKFEVASKMVAQLDHRLIITAKLRAPFDLNKLLNVLVNLLIREYFECELKNLLDSAKKMRILSRSTVSLNRGDRFPARLLNLLLMRLKTLLVRSNPIKNLYTDTDSFWASLFSIVFSTSSPRKIFFKSIM